MVASSSHSMEDDREMNSNDIVQLHNLSHKKQANNKDSSSNVNTLLIKSSHNQSRKRRKKRKRKNDSDVGSDSNMIYFENHNYNHINDNNNGNHIIKTNRNANGRRKIKNFDSNDSNKINQTTTTRRDYQSSENLTLWIFRIKKPLDKLNATDNIDDKVWWQKTKLWFHLTINMKIFFFF